MQKNESFLCVGGPRAGQRIAVANGKGFATAVAKKSNGGDYVYVEHFHYRRETWHSPQGDISFWALEGMTALDLMTALIEAYEKLYAPPS